MADYMPNSDADFMQWVRTFYAYVIAHAVTLGLGEAELDALQAEKPLWENSYSTHLTAQNAAVGARLEKDNHRATMESILRPLVGRIQKYSGTTDADRAALGITIPSTTVQTTTISETDRPVAFIDVGQRSKHLVKVENSTTAGASKARPAWAMACEIYRKFGDLPASDGSDLEYVGLTTRGRAVIEYPAVDAGKTVHYMFRWVSRTGEPGSWSETESATVAA